MTNDDDVYDHNDTHSSLKPFIHIQNNQYWDILLKFKNQIRYIRWRTPEKKASWHPHPVHECQCAEFISSQRPHHKGGGAEHKREAGWLYIQHMDNSHYASMCFVMICLGIALSCYGIRVSRCGDASVCCLAHSYPCFQLRAKWRHS